LLPDYDFCSTTNCSLQRKKKKVLEWVTPKISLMDAGNTGGKDPNVCEAENSNDECNLLAGAWGPSCTILA